jgi:hypothetical protein
MASLPAQPESSKKIETTTEGEVPGVCHIHTFLWMNCQFKSFTVIGLDAGLIANRIDLFFKRIHGFIPMLHEHNFRKKYCVRDAETERYSDLVAEDALTITAMMALSARFSSNDFFGQTSPKERGEPFAIQARSLYDEALRLEKLDECSLGLLQGCVLLAFYQQTSKPTTQSWLLIGTCCRLAVDLGLNNVDKDMTQNKDLSPSDEEPTVPWSSREEKRRLWWLIWELDIFAATILRRPHMLEKDQMNVLLPVSDESWHSGRPTESAFMQTNVLHTWKTLSTSPNQDERAWLLVTTCLMAKAHDLSLHPRTTLQELLDFELTLNCFALLLPGQFHLDPCPPVFNESNFASQNWIIATIFMLHT